MHVDRFVGCIQQEILVRVIKREYGMAITKAEWMKLRKTANKVTGSMCLDSTFVELMKISLKFVIAIEKEYNERFVATRISDIVKDMMSSGVLAGISNQNYYRYVRAAKSMLRHDSFVAIVESQNSSDAEVKKTGHLLIG